MDIKLSTRAQVLLSQYMDLARQADDSKPQELAKLDTHLDRLQESVFIEVLNQYDKQTRKELLAMVCYSNGEPGHWLETITISKGASMDVIRKTALQKCAAAWETDEAQTSHLHLQALFSTDEDGRMYCAHFEDIPIDQG